MRLPLVAALLLASPAFGQITPDQLLANWQGIAADTGSDFTFANLERTPGSLTLREVAFGSKFGPPLQWVRLDGQDDGSVDIYFSRNLENITSTEESDSYSSIRTLSLKGLALNASGDPTAVLYRFSIASITSNTITVRSSVPNTTYLQLGGLSGELLHEPAAYARRFSGFATLDSLTVNDQRESTDPAKRSSLNWALNNARLELDLTFPNDIATTPKGDVPKGFRLNATLISGPYQLRIAQGEGAVFSFDQQSGAVIVAVDATQFTYAFSTELANMALQTNAPATPGFGLNAEAAALEIKLPFRKLDAAQDFSVASRVTGLNLAADSWQRLDPDAVLSRAAASFGFALTGSVKVLENLFDTPARTALNGPPFALRTLSLNGMSLDFAGFGLSGNGALTFGAARTEPISGLPEATGALDFSLTGALGLLDKIARLDWVQTSIVIAAKGALGVFASPGKTADSFTTRIAFSEGGNISINGQQVR